MGVYDFGTSISIRIRSHDQYQLSNIDCFCGYYLHLLFSFRTIPLDTYCTEQNKEISHWLHKFGMRERHSLIFDDEFPVKYLNCATLIRLNY